MTDDEKRLLQQLFVQEIIQVEWQRHVGHDLKGKEVVTFGRRCLDKYQIRRNTEKLTDIVARMLGLHYDNDKGIWVIPVENNPENSPQE